MSRSPSFWSPSGALLAGLTGALLAVASAGGQEAAPGPAEPEGNTEQIAAALKLTASEAKKYSFSIGPHGAPRLREEPLLKWSNPAAGEIHGNVFLWTLGQRPAVVGSLFKWFSPHTHMSHEFHSLAEAPLSGRYDGQEKWTTKAAGVNFSPVPDAPAPAQTAAQRLLQMKRIAKDFAVTKRERDDSRQELRLLPQPIYRYAAADEQIVDGALFVFVQGTDPETFVLVEARGEKGKEAWVYAPARMNGVGFTLRYREKEVWSVEAMPWRDIGSHGEIYTSFLHPMPQ
jgi:hypothetical protein